MNCKLNDRAFVTRARPATAPGNDAVGNALLGRVVRVVRLHYLRGLPYWRLEQEINLPEHDYIVEGIEDYCLTPIRGESTDDDIPTNVSDPLTIPEPSEA